jgi:antitoxin ParD1/3/4
LNNKSEIETDESKVFTLRVAIKEGLNSPRVKDFDFEENLIKLKSEKNRTIKSIYESNPSRK